MYMAFPAIAAGRRELVGTWTRVTPTPISDTLYISVPFDTRPTRATDPGAAMRYLLLMPMRATKHFPTWIGQADLGDIGVLAETCGFDAIGMTDHPFPDDEWLARGGHHSFDPFVALSFVGAAARRIRLATFVLVNGYRHPYVAAKAYASLDRLSGGRVIAGMAAGYLRREFEALDASWDDRGARFDAALDAMRAAWLGRTVERDGLFAAHGHTQLPPPIQPGGPPIWVGGNSRAARRRAALAADGWVPIGQPADMARITHTPPLETLEELTSMIAEVQNLRDQHGLGAADVCFAPFGDRTDIGPWATQVARSLDAYEEAGVTWLVVEPTSRSFTAFADDVRRVADVLVGGSH